MIKLLKKLSNMFRKPKRYSVFTRKGVGTGRYFSYMQVNYDSVFLGTYPSREQAELVAILAIAKEQQ